MLPVHRNVFYDVRGVEGDGTGFRARARAPEGEGAREGAREGEGEGEGETSIACRLDRYRSDTNSRQAASW